MRRGNLQSVPANYLRARFSWMASRRLVSSQDGVGHRPAREPSMILSRPRNSLADSFGSWECREDIVEAGSPGSCRGNRLHAPKFPRYDEKSPPLPRRRIAQNACCAMRLGYPQASIGRLLSYEGWVPFSRNQSACRSSRFCSTSPTCCLRRSIWTRRSGELPNWCVKSSITRSSPFFY